MLVMEKLKTMSDSEIYLSKNDTLRSIKNRRSVRMFLDRIVSDEDLQIILHAANQAPSAHNQQSWRFVVLRGKKKAELANLVNTMADYFPKPSCVLLRLERRPRDLRHR